MIFGYCRVSTIDQNPDRQIDALKELGVDERLIYTDKYTGIKKERPGLTKLLSLLQENDTLYVLSYDRLTRDPLYLFDLIAMFNKKNIIFKSIKENFDIRTPTGKFALAIFAHTAEFIRSNIIETAKEGFRAGHNRNKKYGRPFKLNNIELNAIENELEKGKTRNEIASELNITTRTLYNYIKFNLTKT